MSIRREMLKYLWSLANILLLAWIGHSVANADPAKQAQYEQIVKKCREEAEKTTHPAAMKLRNAFTPVPNNPQDIKKLLEENFPGVRALLESRGVKVFVQGEPENTERCRGAGGAGFYWSEGNEKAVFLCRTSNVKNLLETFRHEALHALQFNLGDNSSERLKELLRYELPGGQTKVANLAAKYSMPGPVAQEYERWNAAENGAISALDNEAKSDERVRRLFSPETGSELSEFSLLSSLGVLTVNQENPLKLQWLPRFAGHGGEQRYKDLLFARMKKAGSCKEPSATGPGDGQFERFCFFVNYQKRNCPTADGVEANWRCFEKFKDHSMREMETLAAESPALKKKVTDLVEGRNKNACYSVSSFCTETQANLATKLDSLTRYLLAKEAGLSEVCQKAVIDIGLAMPGAHDAAGWERLYGLPLRKYESEGWEGLQQAALDGDVKSLMEQAYGKSNSELTGFEGMKPELCEKAVAHKDCQNRNYNGGTTQTQRSAPGEQN